MVVDQNLEIRSNDNNIAIWDDKLEAEDAIEGIAHYASPKDKFKVLRVTLTASPAGWR